MSIRNRDNSPQKPICASNQEENVTDCVNRKETIEDSLERELVHYFKGWGEGDEKYQRTEKELRDRS